MRLATEDGARGGGVVVTKAKWVRGSSKQGRHEANCPRCAFTASGAAGIGGRTSRVSRLAKRHVEETGHRVEVKSTIVHLWVPE